AANKIGAIIVPMDVRYRHADFINLIPGMNPSLIISLIADDKVNFRNILKELKLEFDELKEVPVFYLGDEQNKNNYYNLIDINLTNDDELTERQSSLYNDDNSLIIWTGGTTGLPKAALLSNKNIVRMCILENRFIRDVLTRNGINERTKMLANLPVSHVGGIVEILGVGIVGGYEIIMHDRWSASKTLKTIHKEAIPFYLGAPTMYRLMMKNEKIESYDLSGLKLALISGEIVNKEFMDLMQINICRTISNGYGSTEMGPEITFTTAGEDYDKIIEGYVGRPLDGVTIQIRDLDGVVLVENEVGEVLVKGDLVCNGYYNNEIENKLAFTDDGYFRTGDLGKLNNDGLWLTGRIKEVIRVGSYTVLPQEVEEVVFNSFALEMAASIGMEDELFGEVVWLVITPKPGFDITENEIISLCKKELADYKVPRKVVFYEIDPNNPPMTRIGKIDRKRIKHELMNY
ncbi:MAG: acyl--CoA ligase, partial [Candidatus Heimdallarchaeota archaeon]|nr:acyl--CoA ligase [Candidatus Heimdallarchaeota archaeon]